MLQFIDNHIGEQKWMIWMKSLYHNWKKEYNIVNRNKDITLAKFYAVAIKLNII